MTDLKPTKKEIEQVIQELGEAMLEVRAASIAEDDAKVRKIKAHKRLSLAREAVRAIQYESLA